MRSLFPYIFIALSIVIFFTIIRPSYNDINTLRVDATSYNLALSNFKDMQNLKDELVTKYSSITPENKSRLAHFLPSSVENIQLILQLEQIAMARGIALKNITFAPTSSVSDPANTNSKTTQTYGTFDLQFKTQATFENFSQFLKDLEHNLRQIDIKGISFAINSDAARITGLDPSIYEYTVKVETYWLKN